MPNVQRRNERDDELSHFRVTWNRHDVNEPPGKETKKSCKKFYTCLNTQISSILIGGENTNKACAKREERTAVVFFVYSTR